MLSVKAQPSAFQADAQGSSYQLQIPSAAPFRNPSQVAEAKSANGKHCAYDANGNMIVRDGQRLEYDPENRLTLVASITSVTTVG